MNEPCNIKVVGELIDEFITDGKVVERFESEYNLVVADILKVLTGLLKSPSTASSLYFANGSGEASWDTAPYTPSTGEGTLVNEIFRKAVLPEGIFYLDGSDNISAVRTNKLQIETVLDYDEGNGDLREAAIFALDATGIKDSGTMCNHKVHIKRVKDNSKMMRRIFKFTFNI